MSQPDAALGHELLDDRRADPDLVRESLRSIARANRWFGGGAAVRFGLGRACAGGNGAPSLTLLDVGTGFGDLPRMAIEWARRRGIVLKAIGIEHHAAAAAAARDRGLPTIIGDGAALPFPAASVDLVLLSQIVHHFAPRSAVGLLRECARVARRAVIVADLRRSTLAAVAFPLAGRLLSLDRHAVRDGVTSLRRGFTVAGLESLMTQAGLGTRVFRRPGARLVAVGRVES
ncbi:MAG TPA: methyltransferase domain-containing protein [Gemmatimonadales bacterium]|nr:methyltransferase domain-containing protein [Gemmatimonadales bacterium]